MDISAVAGAYEGLKAAKELLAVAFNAKVDAEAKAKILEAQQQLGQIQDTLFSVREQLFALQSERDDMSRRLEDGQRWNDRVAEYELIKTQGGAVVLQSKAQPQHFACPSCLNKRELHILQTNRTFSGKYRCTGCGSEYPIEPRQDPNVDPIPTVNPWRGGA